jgi:hypothetical protein
VELRDIRVELAQDVKRVRAVNLNIDLPVTTVGRYRSFTLPSLKAYEVIVVE